MSQISVSHCAALSLSLGGGGGTKGPRSSSDTAALPVNVSPRDDRQR